MLHLDLYSAEKLMAIEVEEKLREAETRRLLRQVGVGRRNWLFLSSCWLLTRLGRVLMALGRRLQHYGSGLPVSLEPAEAVGRE